jgi:hypothetical protein
MSFQDRKVSVTVDESTSLGKQPVLIVSEVKWPRYRPGMAQTVGRGIALLFHDHGTRREWVVSITPRPYFTPGKDPVPIVQEAGWAPGPVWTGAENLVPHRDSIPDRPSGSSVAIPTEPAGPQYKSCANFIDWKWQILNDFRPRPDDSLWETDQQVHMQICIFVVL